MLHIKGPVINQRWERGLTEDLIGNKPQSFNKIELNKNPTQPLQL
jgi:hypothetical protein